MTLSAILRRAAVRRLAFPMNLLTWAPPDDARNDRDDARTVVFGILRAGALVADAAASAGEGFAHAADVRLTEALATLDAARAAVENLREPFAALARATLARERTRYAPPRTVTTRVDPRTAPPSPHVLKASDPRRNAPPGWCSR